MNSANTTTEIRSTLASLAKTYEPRRARFRNLVPFKDEIRELRSRGAAFITIAEILKRHSVKASHETVRRFYREAVEQKAARGKRRRKRSRRAEQMRLQNNGNSESQERQRESGKSKEQAPAKSTIARRERGPRIARIEDL
ncbi:MAG: hypothetical protein L0Z50_34675 [Verrucomicrobiales bacterium]|nr:hypothetical protein [Verrucomicrobiales bacterium]